MKSASGATASGLTYADLERVTVHFGVPENQIRRDHLISHLLAVIAASDLCAQVTFFGGTALTRTVLPNLRLSEDIDLIATGPLPRSQIAAQLQQTLNRAVARTHGRLSWEPDLPTTVSPNPATIVTDDGLAVQIQLVSPVGYPLWPSAIAPLVQRYSDVRRASLRVLTSEAFVAAKTAALASRHAPRDLFDLWGLAMENKITASAAEVYRALGPTGNNPSPHLFDFDLPEASWRAALSHQCRLTVTAQDARSMVAAAWAEVTAE
jgi:predicted nucleotidyltransferase component of viral defense system